MSRSMYMLSALAPATMSTVPSIASPATGRLIFTGASHKPPAVVVMTRAVTRGLVSATRSPGATPVTRFDS
jgi:hypothetical protein